MKKIEIRTPKWHPEPSVGISERYEEDVEIKIIYKNKKGERIYPQRYFIPWERLKDYPLIEFKQRMPKVRLVPITMLETL
jgi:hypothetical protein